MKTYLIDKVKISKVGPNHIVDFIGYNNMSHALKFLGDDIRVLYDEVNRYAKEHYPEWLDE